jgi:hypothetical protein
VPSLKIADNMIKDENNVDEDKNQVNGDQDNDYKTTTKGSMVNPYSLGSENHIDMVIHEGGFPSSKAANLMMSLDLRGKALHIEWKSSN